MNQTREPVPPPNASPPPPPNPTPGRPLRRTRDGAVSGVCEGLARYLAIDVTLVRLVFVLATVVGGVGLILYIAGWALIPVEGSDGPAIFDSVTRNSMGLVVGAAVLLAGMIVLLATTDLIVEDTVVVGVALLGIGWWVLNQRSEEVATTPTSNANPSATATTSMPPGPAAPEAFFDMGDVGISERADETAPMGPLLPAVVSPATPPSDASQVYWGAPHLESNTARVPPPTPSEPGPPVTSTTLGIATLAVGALLVLRTVFSLDIPAVAIAGTATLIIGGGLVASAFLGRARWLWFFAVVSLMGMAIAPLLDSAIKGGVGEASYRVTSLEDLEPVYELGMGDLKVDLSDLPPGYDRTVEIKLGAGYANVIVPRNATVIVNGTARFGYVEVERDDEAGIDPGIQTRFGGDDDSVLVIKANVTFGALEIERD